MAVVRLRVAVELAVAASYSWDTAQAHSELLAVDLASHRGP